ncbi:MAG: hypothetical protein GEU82_18005 [Luteitalea sp.]|nr:hypothetical protein [Luteitalea sp.]
MRRRLLELLGIAAVMMALVMFLQLSAAAQDSARGTTGTAASGPAPKTTWGHPDLEGIWLDEFATPLERPAKFANKEFFTDEERAEQDAVRSGNVGRNRRVERGSQQDVAGAYNAVFTSAKPTGKRTSMVVEPANGQIPALTPEAQERNRRDREFRLALLQNTETCKNKSPACNGGQFGPPSPRFAEVAPYYNTQRMNRHNGPEDQSLGDRCMSGATPDFNGFKRIVQGPDSVAIGIDTGQGQGYQRIVYLSGNHPPSSVRMRHGDSRGRFEGNTLVVETTNFSPKFPYRTADANRKLVERITRVDANTMEYAATITDPTVWTAPWTVKQELTMQPDEQNRIYYEPRCHEGNYGLPALLIGARMDEKAFAEGRGPDPRSQDTATDFGPGGDVQ